MPLDVDIKLALLFQWHSPCVRSWAFIHSCSWNGTWRHFTRLNHVLKNKFCFFFEKRFTFSFMKKLCLLFKKNEDIPVLEFFYRIHYLIYIEISFISLTVHFLTVYSELSREVFHTWNDQYEKKLEMKIEIR